MLILLALFACTKDDVQDSEVEDTQVEEVDPDADGDGFDSIAEGGEDCDDEDATVFPGAEEICDEIDQDCDGDLVEDFVNIDGDGYADCADPDPCATPDTSLASWYPGEDMADISGGVVLQGAASSVPGVVGQSWDLSLTEEGLYNYNSPAWLSSNSWSSEMWVQTEESDAILALHAACLGKCAGGENQASALIFRIGTGGTLELVVNAASQPFAEGYETLVGATVVNDGAWHHIAGVVDSGNGTLNVYVDGVLDATATAVSPLDGFANIPNNEEPFWMGFLFQEDNLDARMDEFSVYTGALSADYVAEVHAAGIAGKCAP